LLKGKLRGKNCLQRNLRGKFQEERSGGIARKVKKLSITQPLRGCTIQFHSGI